MRNGERIYPSRIWWMKWGRALPIWRGSDEWGRHTIVIQIPWLGGIVIATRACTHDDMQQFACTWPSCPYLGMVPDDFCPTHDPEWLAA